ncbi:MAG: hypothetical protein HY788_09595 [Deltaproteobacteria bacterium]|nr:hypothetical protein [Deltaproteobacteria bacterium]
MKKRRHPQCLKSHCLKLAHREGLCEEHYEEHLRQKIRHQEALDALHFSVVEGDPLNDPELSKKLRTLQKWWQWACSILNPGLEDAGMEDKAQYATRWCIALAQEIVDAEIAIRKGVSPPDSLETTREWVWSRFRGLEAELMSNGLNRPE